MHLLLYDNPLYQIAVVVFPRAEELKFRADKRFKEMGKEVPAEAVNEMLGILMHNISTHLLVSFCFVVVLLWHFDNVNFAANYTLPMSKEMHFTDEYFDQV